MAEAPNRRPLARRPPVLLLLALALVAMSSVGWAAEIGGEPAPAGEGPPLVVAIELRSDVDLNVERTLGDYLAIHVGEPLTEDAVRRTLSNLYVTGRASRIAVGTRQAPGGVVVVLSLWSNVVVEEVRLEGEPKGIPRRELMAAIPDQENRPLVESRVLRGDFRLEELLNDRGFLGAKVDLRVSPPDERNRVVVTYLLQPGPAAQVGQITFEGDLGPFDAAQLTEELRRGVGEPYRRRRGRTDAERLQSWLVEQGYRTASVELVEESYRPQEALMDLTYRVEVGPEVRLEVVGVEREKLRKKNLLPFLGEDGYDEALVLQAEERIREFYQRQGHYGVSVEYLEKRTTTPDGGAVLTLVLEVHPGEIYPLESLEFQGNESFPKERLLQLVETSPERFLGLADGHLVSEVLAADLQNLRSLYALEGFVGTRVGPPEVDVRKGRIHLTIPIEEGSRRRVEALSFEGIDAFPRTEVRRDFAPDEGGGYSETLLEDSLDALRARYDEAGYSQAQVSAVTEWNEDRSRVSITVQVLEGPQQRLGSVLVVGNRKTKSSAILRALDVRPGDPVSETRLLEMERNLYRLGIFNRVEAEFTAGDLGFTRQDVLIRVTEGRTRSLNFEVGVDSDDGVRGLVGLGLRNVLGRAYTFSTDVRISQEDQRFRMTFEQPELRFLPYGMAYQLLLLDEDRESYEAERRVARIETVPVENSPPFTFAVEGRRIEISELDDILVSDEESGLPVSDAPVRAGVLSPAETGPGGRPEPVELVSFVPTLQFDRRDDPLSPTRGWATSAEAQITLPELGTDFGYLRFFGQHSRYLPLGEGRVLAAGARLGIIEILETVEGAEGDPLLSVPLDDRFFAGGRTTHRAFSRFELGIDGETRIREGDERASIGGNGLVLVNLEYRFPLFGALGGTVFYDIGNLWRDWRDIDDRVRHGIGIGARYQSPIGPLRIDVGYKLDAEPGESDFEVHFSFGNPF